MMKQLRKVLSILCAIALLISGMTFALAEDTEAEAPVYEEPVYEEPVYEAPAYEEPAYEEPAYEEPVYVEPADEEPAYEEPVYESPAAEEPAYAEPVAAEPVVEEPVVVEPVAVEPVVVEPVVVEPVAEEPAAEEPAAEEPAAEDASIYNEETTDEDGLVEIDDGWGYVDPEVIEENTPEITDELKGIRNADLAVGQVLSETLEFGEELVIRLQGGNASVVTLKLYAPYGASINTKVDEKAVGFTPAESDDPSMAMYTYELTGAAGRSFEIVLSSYDTVSFKLAAVAEQAEEITEPAEQEEELFPAEDESETTDDEPSDEYITEDDTEETPVPTLQVSVKTYDALKVGYSISDSLIAGQKAKIMVKCGKNLNVALTLTADPDDVVVTIDGNDASFIPAGDGTYTCILSDVAFRKFNVVIAAKQDLDFTLSAASAGEQLAEGEEEDDEEEKTEEINKEEAETEPAEEVTEETAEETETAEEAEKTEESAEETTEEPTEETEEGKEPADGEEEKTEESEDEKSEESEEENTEEPEEENTEQLTDEQMTELGYLKIQVLNTKGADIYAATEEGAEVIGHADYESEIWIKIVEAEGWAEVYCAEAEAHSYIRLADIDRQPLTDEQIAELGYRKVKISNQNGTDIYSSTTEEGEVIDHIPYDSELWIKDLETEGWAEVYTEMEPLQYVKLAEIEKQPLTDEDMLQLEYIKAYVAIDIGANVYAGTGTEEEPIDHLDCGTELWIKLIEESERALIYDEDENAAPQYINVVDVVALLKPDGIGDLPVRELIVHSSADEAEYVILGMPITFDTELVNFLEDDHYAVQWKYSADGEEFIDIEDATDLKYEFVLDMDNMNYIWRVSVVLVTAEE